MKRLIFLILVTLLPMVASLAANAQELTVSDVQNSGCMRSMRSRVNENEIRRTIILTKEGTILTVQILGYLSNCATEGFDVTPSISGDSGSPYSVSIDVEPIMSLEDQMMCTCPFNVSFTIHGLEPNSFQFSCWWFEGSVELTEGEPLTLEDIKENVYIANASYTLDKVNFTAVLQSADRGIADWDIPSELDYEDQKYAVTIINPYAFYDHSALKSVNIPSSVNNIGYNAFYRCPNLTDVYCYAENVPETGNNVFKETPISSATLHVPAGSVDKYKATSPWKDFGTIVGIPEEYYPEGTKWTEIRLDTLKYNSWYSKVGEDWVPNFETIEYRVQGECSAWDEVFKKVYSNGPEWTDSLAFLLLESGHNVETTVIVEDFVMCSGATYQFNWSVGMRLWFQDILEANATCFPPCGLYNYGMIDEIKEGVFGGVRPLKYVDLNGKAPTDPEQPWLDYADTKGGRIIQGIGITEWNDGECLFGPPNPYYTLYGWTSGYKDRHYRSMLVHFERNNEVLYDVWPKKEIPSGITIKGSQSANQGALYDLQGRKVANPRKGIYIKDGNKILIK